MAEGKKSFIIYVSWKLWLDALDDKQKGQWLNWMLDYTNDLNPEYPTDKAVEVACRMAQDTLKRDLKKYKAQCERVNRINEERKRKSEEQKRNDIETKSKRSRNKVVCDNDNDNVNDNDNDIPKGNKENVIKEKSTPSRFIPPTLEQITQYCTERNNLVDPVRFFNFYQSKGWMVGKNKMKDWKAAVRTWEKEAGFKTSGEDYSGYEFIDGKYYNGGFECLVVPDEVRRKFEGKQ